MGNVTVTHMQSLQGEAKGDTSDDKRATQGSILSLGWGLPGRTRGEC